VLAAASDARAGDGKEVTDMKSFPCKCSSCRERAVAPITLPSYTADLEHDGRAYAVTVSDLDGLRCGNCGNQVIPDDSFDRLTAELRRQAGLLAPGEIKGNRDRLHLTQKALAGHLRVSDSTLCRWETGGQIQQRPMDLLMRLYFDIPQVREQLAKGFSSETFVSPGPDASKTIEKQLG
jgi:DNA-binding transcriptional regulator YiaG